MVIDGSGGGGNGMVGLIPISVLRRHYISSSPPPENTDTELTKEIHLIEHSETGEQTVCLEAWIVSWRLIRCRLPNVVTDVTYKRIRQKALNMFADVGAKGGPGISIFTDVTCKTYKI